MRNENPRIQESPEFLRMSLAAAMTLGLKTGAFYRNARLYCINLLLTYTSGCAARCAYCGLSRKRPGDYEKKSFIRVAWPTHHLDEIIGRIAGRQDRIKRICVSMVTHKRAVADTKTVCRRLRRSFDIPVSLLISPTITAGEDLRDFKEAGADKLGVAVDLATPELFDRYRGAGVGGPHRWENYMSCLREAVAVFGEGNAGSHFMVGMGETEREMVNAIQRVQDMGGWTHLFSFYPEAESALANRPLPELDHYRRIQLGRYVIDEDMVHADRMGFDALGRLVDFGIEADQLDAIIDSGEPFRTSGCPGYDGEVACNRPYANSRPGPDIRNYPFPPTPEDIRRIRGQMNLPPRGRKSSTA